MYEVQTPGQLLTIPVEEKSASLCRQILISYVGELSVRSCGKHPSFYTA